MSLPLIFAWSSSRDTCEFEGHVLVDGEAMNNIPADVARPMGADRGIVVNVGDLTDLASDKAD